MRELPEKDWGPFEAVTALCSLYYLDPGSMAQVNSEGFRDSPR